MLLDLWDRINFTATVVNVATGEVVASANFSGYKSSDAVLEEFADKLASLVK